MKNRILQKSGGTATPPTPVAPPTPSFYGPGKDKTCVLTKMMLLNEMQAFFTS